MTSNQKTPDGQAEDPTAGGTAGDKLANVPGSGVRIGLSNAVVQMRIVWFLIYFVSTDGFGLRMDSWGGFGAGAGSGVSGWWGPLQLLVALMSIAAIIPGVRSLRRWRKSRLGMAMWGVGLVPIYLLATSLVRAIAGSHIGFDEILRNLMQLHFYMLIYLYAYLISKPKGLEEALRALAVYSLVASVCIIVIVSFDVQTDSAHIVTSITNITHAFKIIFPASYLVAVGWLFYLCRYLVFKRFRDLCASAVCLSATAMQINRSTQLAIILTILVLFYWLLSSGQAISRKQKRAVVISVGVLIAGVVYYVVHSEMARAYLLASSIEMLSVSADFLHRLMLVWNSLNYVISSTFGLGVGLKWQSVDVDIDFRTYILTAFVAGPTFDSAYANLIIVLGLPGILLFGWIASNLAAMANSLRGVQDDAFGRMFGLFIGTFLVYSLMIALAMDILLIFNAAATFILVLVSATRFQELRAGR